NNVARLHRRASDEVVATGVDLDTAAGAVVDRLRSVRPEAEIVALDDIAVAVELDRTSLCIRRDTAQHAIAAIKYYCVVGATHHQLHSAARLRGAVDRHGFVGVGGCGIDHV